MGSGWHQENKRHSDAARKGWANKLQKPRVLVNNLTQNIQVFDTIAFNNGSLPLPPEHRETYDRVDDLFNEHELLLKRIEYEYGSVENFNQAINSGDQQAQEARDELMLMQQKIYEGLYALDGMDSRSIKLVKKNLDKQYPASMYRMGEEVNQILMGENNQSAFKRKPNKEGIVSDAPTQVVYNPDKGNFDESDSGGFDDTSLDGDFNNDTGDEPTV